MEDKNDQTTTKGELEKLPSKEKLSELAFGTVSQLKNLIYEQGIMFLEIGRLLKFIRDGELFKYLGDGGYDSFTMFVNNSDIGIKQATAYAYIRIYEIWVEKLGYTHEELADVPWSKLHMLVRRVNPENKKEGEEWLHKAKALGYGDFIEELKDKKANDGHEDHLQYPHFYRCKTCGKYRTDEPEKLCTC